MMKFHCVLAALTVLAAACDNQCVPGESRCDGDTILACGGPESDQFRSLYPGCGDDRCLDIELDGLRHAVCSTTGQPDPRCPARAYALLCVDDSTLLRCSEGYGWDEQTCRGACISDEPDGSDGFCSFDAAPSPVCSFDGPACETDSSVQCSRGYVVDRIACPNGPCVASPFSLFGGDRPTYCVTQATCETQGARCASSSRIEGCTSGRVVAMQCNPRTSCDQFTVNPTAPMESWQTEAMCIEH